MGSIAKGLAAALLAAAAGIPAAHAQKVHEIDVAGVASEIRATQGVPTVVLLYGSACSLSEAMFPGFVSLAREYERRGVRFLVYSTDKAENVYWIPEFLKQNRASFEPVVIRSWPAGELGRQMKPLGIQVDKTWTRPLVAVRDREGRVVLQTEGETDLRSLRAALARVAR